LLSFYNYGSDIDYTKNFLTDEDIKTLILNDSLDNIKK